MFGFSSGSDMQVGLVAQHTRRLHRIIDALLREFLQGVKSLLIDQIALFDPALQAIGGAHAGKTLLVLQHLHALPVLDRAHAVVDGGHLVAQRGLRRRDIVDLEHAMPSAVAGSKAESRKQRQRQRQPPNMRWEKTRHFCRQAFTRGMIFPL